MNRFKIILLRYWFTLSYLSSRFYCETFLVMGEICYMPNKMRFSKSFCGIYVQFGWQLLETLWIRGKDTSLFHCYLKKNYLCLSSVSLVWLLHLNWMLFSFFAPVNLNPLIMGLNYKSHIWFVKVRKTTNGMRIGKGKNCRERAQVLE